MPSQPVWLSRGKDRVQAVILKGEEQQTPYSLQRIFQDLT